MPLEIRDGSGDVGGAVGKLTHVTECRTQAG